MKPSPYRYVLAHTAGVSQILGVLGGLALFLACLHVEGILILQAEVLFWVVLAVVPVAAVGWIVGIVCLWGMLLGPLVARMQGWPFAVGDRVWILSGRRKNTLATVDEVWAERGQVRVEFEPERKAQVDDVYCAVAVCRARS